MIQKKHQTQLSANPIFTTIKLSPIHNLKEKKSRKKEKKAIQDPFLNSLRPKMAAHFTTKLSLALILTTAAISVASARHGKLKHTNLILYLQDFANGPNPTFIPVAGIAGKSWNFTQFGTIFVTDDPITAGPEPNSTALGRAQGIYAVAAADGRNLMVALTLALADGNSIELQGTSRQFEGVRELGVVSGTGKFRFARGFALSKNVVTDISNGYTVVQFNVTVEHY